MSLVVRKERARNGMIADPGPLNENNNEFAGEFNGYMQRDNIPTNGVTAPMIEVGTFTRVIADPQSTVITLDSTSQEWQSKVGADPLHEVTDAVDTDSILEIEWSGGHKVTSRGADRDCIRYHITVNGVEIASTGPLGEQYQWASVALNGVIAVQAGPIYVTVAAMLANYSDEIASPGLFAITSGVNSDFDITERELVILVRGR